MKIYNWWSAPGGPEYTPLTDADEKRFAWFDELSGDPLPAIDEWSSPTLTQYLGETGRRAPRPVTDSPSSGPINLISEQARVALSAFLDRHADLYPVILDDVVDQAFYMVVVTTVLDCIDREKSTGPRQKYGPNPKWFASVHTWEFDDACIGDAAMFVLPDDATNIFVTEAFKREVEAAGLRGFCLWTSFWQEDPWIS